MTRPGRSKNFKLYQAIIDMFGSQKNFADTINKHDSLVSRVVSMKWNLDPDEKEIWAQLLGEKVEDLWP